MQSRLHRLQTSLCVSFQVTYHHVNTEAWVSGYQVDFDNLQKNYPAMAPKDLASLGYVGLTSLYFSSDQSLG